MSVQPIYSDAPPNFEPAGAAEARIHDTVFVAFDTETTGLSPVACRLVELCGVKFLADGTEISTFQALINPEMHIPEAASAVHGINDGDVWDQPNFAEVVPAFIEWATDPEVDGMRGNTVLLAHNASFDIGFLEVAMCKLRMEMPRNIVLDTLSLSRATIDDCASYRLQSLVEHLELDQDAGYHRALADSYHVRNLFLRILDCFGEDVTIGDISDAAEVMRFVDPSTPIEESEWANSPEMSSIKEAIAGGYDLRIRYSGMRKSERIVTPRSVLFTRGKPYLSAFCHMAAAERTFRVDKIIGLEPMVSNL